MTPATPAHGGSRAIQSTALNGGAIPGIDRAEALGLVPIMDGPDLDDLLARAVALRDARSHGRITYSPKVFIPLTKLCRDVCHYCTFAQPPRRGERAYLNREEVLEIARAGVAAGCREALLSTWWRRPGACGRSRRDGPG